MTILEGLMIDMVGRTLPYRRVANIIVLRERTDVAEAASFRATFGIVMGMVAGSALWGGLILAVLTLG